MSRSCLKLARVDHPLFWSRAGESPGCRRRDRLTTSTVFRPCANEPASEHASGNAALPRLQMSP
eukprot:15464646-Alexandrium_andersonii.AAC.1